MIGLLLHPETQKMLDSLIKQQPHAVMLSGNEGSGKQFTGKWLAARFLQTEVSHIDKYPYFLHVQPDGKTFTIDQVRDLQRFVHLKTTGKSSIRRVALLVDTHLMTTEAQNALLKLLEEPPEDTVLILTAQGNKALKPTIYSRVQKVHIRPVRRQDITAYAPAEQSEIEKAYMLSGGDAGLLLALLKDTDGHELAAAIALAKQLIRSSAFERLAKVDELSKNKEGLPVLFMALKRISSAALKQAVVKHDTKLKVRWQKTLEALYAGERNLNASANTKLILTDLFLTL